MAVLLQGETAAGAYKLRKTVFCIRQTEQIMEKTEAKGALTLKPPGVLCIPLLQACNACFKTFSGLPVQQ